MYRPSLTDLPAFTLPAGYRLRWYKPGDRQTWLDVQTAAEKILRITGETFEAQFDGDEVELARRMCFVTDEAGQAVGTATAWYGDQVHGREMGRIHWVAIVPEHQGKGLSRPLLAGVCQRLAELGHRDVYLVTSTARVPAVNLYLSFGFEPLIESEEQREDWKSAESRFKYAIHV